MNAPERYEVRPAGSCWLIWDLAENQVFGRAVGTMAAATMAADLLNGHVDPADEEGVLFLVAMVMIESEPEPAVTVPR